MEHWTANRAKMVAVVGALLCASVGQAAIWDGGGDGTTYDDPLNWDTNVTPTGSNPVTINGATFGATSGSPLVINLNGVRNIAGATVNVSGHVKFTNSVSGDDFTTGATGTFNATNVVFDTNIGVVDNATNIANNLNFTNVTYNTPGLGIRFGAPTTSTITGSSFTADNVWNLRSGSGTNAISVIIDSSTTSGRVLTMNNNSGTVAAASLTVRNGSISTFSGSAAHNIGDIAGANGTPTITVDNSRVNLRTTNASGINFNPKAKLVTNNNAIIEMQGHVNNRITNAANFDGEGLTVIFDPLASTMATYEVAGTNFGVNSAGLSANYSLDKLILGTNTGSSMRLVDTVDNDGAAGSDSLYVDVLELAGDTTLELNGLGFGYGSLVYNGHSLTIFRFTAPDSDPLNSRLLTATNGNEPGIAQSLYTFNHVPEPSSLAVVAFMAARLLRRRRSAQTARRR